LRCDVLQCVFEGRVLRLQLCNGRSAWAIAAEQSIRYSTDLAAFSQILAVPLPYLEYSRSDLLKVAVNVRECVRRSSQSFCMWQERPIGRAKGHQFYCLQGHSLIDIFCLISISSSHLLVLNNTPAYAAMHPHLHTKDNPGAPLRSETF
jgi:hypothetical protein